MVMTRKGQGNDNDNGDDNGYSDGEGDGKGEGEDDGNTDGYMVDGNMVNRRSSDKIKDILFIKPFLLDFSSDFNRITF